MRNLSPVTWKQLISKLKSLGFEGPYSGGKHAFMIKGDIVLTIPNPHKNEIGIDLLKRILKEAGIPREVWLRNK